MIIHWRIGYKYNAVSIKNNHLQKESNLLGEVNE